MKIGKTCTTCGGGVTERDVVRCVTCKQRLHSPCEPYETSFECRICSDEPWIGAVDF